MSLWSETGSGSQALSSTPPYSIDGSTPFSHPTPGCNQVHLHQDISTQFFLGIAEGLVYNINSLFQVPYENRTDLVVDYFKMSVEMSTYLVAFVVCDFSNITKQTKRGVKVCYCITHYSLHYNSIHCAPSMFAVL